MKTLAKRGKLKMNRIWINYCLWEDWKNGLYSKIKQDELIDSVVLFLCDSSLFYETSMKMLKEWPNSMNQNLSYVKSNRSSYIGQAASCYYNGANIVTTCKAWEKMTIDQRKNANDVADKVIAFYDLNIYCNPKTENNNEEIS